MKKIISAALCLAMVLLFTACEGNTIGTIKGAEYEEIIIGDVKYLRTFDSGISYSDKDKYLGNVSDGKNTFKAYSVKFDSAAEYIYCMWNQEGMIYQKADSIPSDDCGTFYKTIDFSAQYIRTNASSYDGDNDNFLWITSVEDLDNYYEQNKNKYYLESVKNPASDQTIGFVDAVKKYDEAFFEQNDLIFIVLEEPSGSNRHEVTSVDLFASLLDRIPYFIQPNIKRIMPEVGTCDMANWHIIIEVDKKYGMNFSQLKYPNITIEKQKEMSETEKIVSVYNNSLDNTFCIFASNGNKGTGFLYKEKYVITNAHVLYDADDFTLLDSKGEEQKGIVIFTDIEKDIAIIRVDGFQGKSVQFGNSDSVSIGEQLLLIGNPAGGDPFSFCTGKRVELEKTFLERINSQNQYIPVDANIVSGYSGGPVFNLNGELIGISNATYIGDLTAYDIDYLGFVIPINRVKEQIERNCI